ncbi:hypothetical protein AAMO2058_000444100 [Amorphochlora amoebiformis]
MRATRRLLASRASSAQMPPPPLSIPSFSVAGRSFVITGGTQGLGLEIGCQLARAGASNIVLVSRSKEKHSQAREKILANADGRHVAVSHVQADLSDSSQTLTVIQRSAEFIRKSASPDTQMPSRLPSRTIDGLINAHGLTKRGNLESTDVSLWNKMMNTNLTSCFILTKCAAEEMKTNKTRGSIVNISSCAAKGGAPFIMAYSVSKAGLNALTKANAAELKPYGIRVNSLDMGWCVTDAESDMRVAATGDEKWFEKADQTMPMGRILRPVDAACAVGFLVSDASMMMTGTCLDLHPELIHGMFSESALDNQVHDDDD